MDMTTGHANVYDGNEENIPNFNALIMYTTCTTSSSADRPRRVLTGRPGRPGYYKGYKHVNLFQINLLLFCELAKSSEDKTK